MAVFNLGSINLDHFYSVSDFPGPGETVSMSDHRCMLGGKGANQSIAIARAEGSVIHIGAMNRGDRAMRDEMANAGIDMDAVQDSQSPTGHAIIVVASDGENQIMIYPGANRAIDMREATDVLDRASPGDWALLQNETNGASRFVEAAKERGMKIAYSAAPFDAEIAAGLIRHADLLVVNEVEASALGEMTGKPLDDTGVQHLVVTRGGEGFEYHGGGTRLRQSAIEVDVVDTTGAGDCFLGYLLAGIDRGDAIESALALAGAAAALQVTRQGTASAIPDRKEAEALLACASHGSRG